MDAADSRIARVSECKEEPLWWHALATKARVRTDFNGKDNWRICLSRLIAAGLVKLEIVDEKCIAALTPRAKDLLQKGES